MTIEENNSKNVSFIVLTTNGNILNILTFQNSIKMKLKQKIQTEVFNNCGSIHDF